MHYRAGSGAGPGAAVGASAGAGADEGVGAGAGASPDEASADVISIMHLFILISATYVLYYIS